MDSLNGVRVGLYLTATIVLVIIGTAVARIAPRLEKALDSVQAIETNTVRTEAELAGLLNVTRQVAIQERSASAEQIKQIDQIAVQTKALIEQASQTVGDLDAAAKQALGGATVDEERLAALLEQTTDSIRDVTAHTDTVLENTAGAIDAVDTRAAMANIVTATENVKDTTADAAASMATVRKGVEFEVKALMAPPRKVKWLAEESARMVGKFFGF